MERRPLSTRLLNGHETNCRLGSRSTTSMPGSSDRKYFAAVAPPQPPPITTTRRALLVMKSPFIVGAHPPRPESADPPSKPSPRPAPEVLRKSLRVDRFMALSSLGETLPDVLSARLATPCPLERMRPPRALSVARLAGPLIPGRGGQASAHCLPRRPGAPPDGGGRAADHHGGRDEIGELQEREERFCGDGEVGQIPISCFTRARICSSSPSR